MVSNIDRRTLLLGAATILLTGAAGDILIGRGGDAAAQSRDDLVMLANRLNLSQEIGQAYLETTLGADDTNTWRVRLGMEAKADRMVQVLRDQATILGLDGKSMSVESAVNAMITGDFRNLRICTVQNWYLSRTECRLAALAVLSKPT